MQKMLRSITAIFLIIASPELFALGLGDARVNSYMGQPLDVRVQLISNSQEELNSVTAGLASASAMEALGISRTVSIPLWFDVHADTENPYIQITSRLPASDPVIQVVVEARWSGGRMVREYTFFLDPPTFPSSSPAPLIINQVTSGAIPAKQQVPEIHPLPDRPIVVQQSRPEPVVDPVTPRQQSAQNSQGDQAEAPSQSAPPSAPGSGAAEADPSLDDTKAAEGTADNTGIAPVADEQNRAETANREPPGETLGPVQNGQTLWGIAATYTRSTPYSINQAMLAIQRLNPDAFGNDNINLLKRGAILRMPVGAEMGRVSVRQAMIESMRQEAAFKAEKAGLPSDLQEPVYANNTLDSVEPDFDTADNQADLVAQQEVVAAAEESLLQLIPPSQGEDSGAAGAGSVLQPTGAVASEDLQEVLARTEEELANAKQENAYLNERIRELEDRVKDSGGEITVTDGELAELESRLKDDRLAPVPEPGPVVINTTTPEKWYSGKEWWLGGLFLLVIGAIVWLMRRLGGTGADDSFVAPAPDGDQSTVTTIRSEAEDILKSLDNPVENTARDPEISKAGAKGNVIDLESFGEPVEETRPPEIQPPEVKPEPVEELRPKPAITPAANEEAVELDGDDPETMLDLARAYISMSDSESARKILEEVIEVGNETQVAEARGMMQEF